MEVMKNTNYEKEETKNHSTRRLIPVDEFGIEKTLAERFLKGLFDFKIEKDFLYYEGHTWVKQNNGHVKIGIDDFLCKFITKIKHIILPPESTLILQERPCCWIAGEFGTVPVVS